MMIPVILSVVLWISGLVTTGTDANSDMRATLDSLPAYLDPGAYSSVLTDLGQFEKLLSDSLDRGGHVDAADLLKLANSYAFVANYSKAINFLKIAAGLAEEDSDDATYAWVKVMLGDGYSELGEYENAIVCYDTANAIFIEQGNLRGQGLVQNGQGLLHFYRNNLTEAKSKLERALEIHESLIYRYGEALAMANLGLVNTSLGAADQAEEYLLRAEEIFAVLGCRKFQANQLANLGMVEMGRGNLDKAETYYNRAMLIFEQVGYAGGVANQLCNLAGILTHRGEFDQSLDYATRALKIHTEIGLKQRCQGDLRNIITNYKARGELNEARTRLIELMVLQEELDNWREAVKTVIEIAYDFRSLSLFDSSVTYFSLAAQKAESKGFPDAAALCVHNAADCYVGMRQFDKATVEFKRALSLFRELGDRQAEARCLIDIGEIQHEKGHESQATETIELAVKVAKESSNPEKAANVYSRAGQFYKEVDQREKAIELFSKSLTCYRQTNWVEGQGYCLCMLAELYGLTGDSNEAMRCYETAVPLLEQTGGDRNLIVALDKLGSTLAARGEYAEALDYLNRALKLIDDKQIPYNRGKIVQTIEIVESEM